MHDWREEDRRQRERLERMSSGGQRADIAGCLNKIAAGDARRELPGVLAYRALMTAQGAHARDIARLNKRHDLLMKTGRLDRLHPDSQMRRRVPASPTSDIPAAERDDAREDRIGPDLAAGRIRDADGGMAADGRARRDKWDDQGVRALTVEEMVKLAAMKVRASRYW